MKILNTKFIFAFLISLLCLAFIVNGLLNTTKRSEQSIIKKNIQEDTKKILGVEIRQQNKDGTKFFIFADTLEESKTELKKIILENSFTTIDQEGILTNIVAGRAIITNNYENFDFANKVEIIKKSRDFHLKTKTLSGSFNKGNYYTNDDVDIVAGNTVITGKALTMRNNGEYIKVEGKATLEMLLSKKVK